jgi:outer membrane biosynthesis protein TonB
MRTSRIRSWLVSLTFLAACGGGAAQTPAETAHDEQVADEDVRVLDFDDDAVAQSATDQAAPTGGEPRSPETIRAVVRSHLSAVAHCYEQLLATAPTAQGRVLLRMTIAADGIVGDVEVAQSTIEAMPAETTTCLQTAARGMHFGAHPEATVVNYPFVFSPSGAPAAVAAPPPASAAPPPASTAAAPPPSTTTAAHHH